MESRLVQLEESFIFEMTRAMALPQNKPFQNLVRLAFGRAIHRFSEIIYEFDHQVEKYGARAGVRWLLPYFVDSHKANGMEIIPQTGPLIIAANHPASYDALAISAYISRSDYKIIIGDIPPYRHLPHLSQYAIFSPNAKDTFGRMQTVRNAIRHLKNGGALLIFPRGGIEPDPAIMPNADVEFGQWSRSLEIFLQHVPQTQIMITMVSGVITRTSMHHPITWFRRARSDRQRLAFIYQMIRQVWTGKELYGLTPRVTFGEVLSNINLRQVLPEIEKSARRVLARHLADHNLPDLA